MITNRLKLWYFWSFVKPDKKDCFKFKYYYFKSRVSNKGNLCIKIFHKSPYGFPVAEVVVHDGELDIRYIGHHSQRSKIIYKMYDMHYGRNNFLKDTDAYKILDSIVRHIKNYEKSGYTYYGIDYRKTMKTAEEILAKLERL